MPNGARRWVFTTNNPVDEDAPQLEDDFRYIVWQAERGEEGTMHLQGFFLLKKRKTLTALKKVSWLTHSHLELARGSDAECINYCKKEETRIDGPWELGEVPEEKKKKLAECAKLIREGTKVQQLKEEFDTVRILHTKNLMLFQGQIRAAKVPRWRDVRTLVLWGETGLGKTRFAYENYALEEIYKLTEPEGKLWWDGYDGQPVLLIDDFSGWIKYRYAILLNLYFIAKHFN